MTAEEFEGLARQYGDTIFRVACHALGSRPDAEDVSQTVLMKLYCAQQDFEGPEHIKHWLLRVTVNECRRVLRSPWRRRVLPLEGFDAPVQIAGGAESGPITYTFNLNEDAPITGVGSVKVVSEGDVDSNGFGSYEVTVNEDGELALADYAPAR